ncbi:hypothetical protein F511_08953 [Dorcoceras hygrometricum]|uniref:Uncharacterized protein n=1 Tax=Dorcoceras hygrometricum TaxID=472368 RepID=A0A2Z7CRE4_9LAMI|nr:hypothetical protein F511_08953 [Dorcoceras hygrometricum]
MGTVIKKKEDKMSLKRSRIQETGENNNTEDLSQEPGNQGLTAAQIAQLMTAIVEQVLACRPFVNPVPAP